MAITDTSPEIRRRVTAVFASMSGAQRVACAAEMAEDSKTIALAGTRSRHPDLSVSASANCWSAENYGRRCR
ncbi:MAG: hypothetical protein R2707_14550 [Acidimicrobiales bacterium]